MAKTVSTLQYLTYAVAVRREWGWIPMRGSPHERARSTAAVAWLACNGRTANRVCVQGPELHDAVHAQEILDWAATIAPLNEYEGRAVDAVKCGVLTQRDAAVTACLLESFDDRDRRDEKIRLAADRKAMDEKSQHFGKVKHRSTYDLVVERVIPVASRYEESSIVIAREGKRNAVMFFCSQDVAMELKEGQEIWVEATVKAHGEYKGAKQTALEAVKVL